MYECERACECGGMPSVFEYMHMPLCVSSHAPAGSKEPGNSGTVVPRDGVGSEAQGFMVSRSQANLA